MDAYDTLTPALLTERNAYLICAGFSAGLVGSFYIDPRARPGGLKRLTKNDPVVIKARMTAFTFVTLASIATVYYILRGDVKFRKQDLSGQLGLLAKALGFVVPLNPIGAITTLFLPLLLTASIYAGYVAELYADGTLRHFDVVALQYLMPLTSLTGFRDVVFSPVVEEVLFRSCMIPLLRLANVPTGEIIFYSPLMFGIAHTHHLYEHYVTRGRTRQALGEGVLKYVFKSIYTSLFGWYAAFLFVRTGSVIPCILSHGLCNMLGLPLPPLLPKPAEKISPPTSPRPYEKAVRPPPSGMRQRVVAVEAPPRTSKSIQVVENEPSESNVALRSKAKHEQVPHTPYPFPYAQDNEHPRQATDERDFIYWRDTWCWKLVFVYAVYLGGYANFFVNLGNWTRPELYE